MDGRDRVWAYFTAIGDPPYGAFAEKILVQYCLHHGIKYYFQRERPAWMDGSIHPSWMWLRAFDDLPDEADFALTWNLDLLPTSLDHNIVDYLRLDRINAVVENPSGIHPTFPHYKYNCGFVGFPRSLRGFFRYICDRFCSNPENWPSYEQYYVNREIGERGMVVHDIPPEFNHLFSDPIRSAEHWFVHYTCNVPMNEKLETMMRHHPKELL